MSWVDAARAWSARRTRPPPRRAIPTRAGLFTLLAPMVLGVAGVTAGNNLLFLLLGATLRTMVLSGILSEAAVLGISLVVTAPRAPEAGTSCRLRLEWRRPPDLPAAYALFFDERKKGPLSLETFARAPDGLLRSDLPLLESSRGISYGLRHFERRGRAELHRCEVWTTYPFALLRKIRDVDVRCDVWVRPHRVELPDILRAGRAKALHGEAAHARGQGVEPYGLREWTEFDPRLRIHALRSARLGSEVVLDMADEQRPVAWVAINNSEGAEDEALERACELAAAYLRDREAKGYRAGIVSVGSAPLNEDLDACLDHLARIRPMPGKLELPAGCIALCPSGTSVLEGVRALSVDAEGRVQ